MAPSCSPQAVSARSLLCNTKPGGSEAGPAAPKFRYSAVGAGPGPVASTSTSNLHLPASAPSSKSHTPPPPATTTAPTTSEKKPKPKPAVVQHAPPPRRESSAGASESGKGKEKAVDQDEAGPSKSLLSRLSGPSDQKAGLNKRDPEEVKKIIFEASKAPYFINEQKKDEELSRKVEGLVAKVDALVSARGGDLSREEGFVDSMIRDLERTRDLSQTVVVVDADAFYASVHELTDPALKGTAFAVGGGVICTASYEARKYGVRSAMAGFVAKKLCPGLRFIDLEFSLYTKISGQIMDILREYGEISPASLDEAYCSLTKYISTNSITPTEAADRMRTHVKDQTGCTVSAGVSPNAMISKIAADFNKPDGQCVVPPTREGCMEFMRDLPVRKIPGIGRVSERWLQALGVLKVSDIYRLRGKLYLVKNEIGLTFLLRAYLGLGTTTIEPPSRTNRKSVSAEETFSTISEVEAMHARLKKIAESLASDLKNGGWSGRTITLKLKLDTFEVISRACTLGKDIYFADTEALYREGKKLLDREIRDRKASFKKGGKVKGKGDGETRIRLLGLKMSNLRDEREREGEKGLNKWAQPRPSTSKAKDDDVKLEDEDDDAEPTDGFVDQEAEESKPPASSDPLWAAFGDDDVFDHRDPAAEEEEEVVDDPSAPRYKPFWTAGESMNSKIESKAKVVAEEDKLSFEGGGGAGAGTVSGKGGKGDVFKRECPVCGVGFMASEIGINAHVNSHFASKEGKKRKSEVGGVGGGKRVKLNEKARPESKNLLSTFLKKRT